MSCVPVPEPATVVRVALCADEDNPATCRLWAVVPGASAAVGTVELANALFPWDDDGFDAEAAEVLFASGQVPRDTVGYCDLYPHDGDRVVHEVYVIVEYRRRGIASQLLRVAAADGGRLRNRGLTPDGRHLWAAAVTG